MNNLWKAFSFTSLFFFDPLRYIKPEHYFPEKAQIIQDRCNACILSNAI